jgi:predicted nucleic acid-binding protein
LTVVLDSEGLSILARLPARPSARMAAHQALSDVLEEALDRGQDVLVPAAGLAELSRGGSHDQVVDACLARFPAIVVVDTDPVLAREIGHLLARAGRGSADHVDASVVAVAVLAGGGVIATADLAAVGALAEGLNGVRVLEI